MTNDPILNNSKLSKGQVDTAPLLLYDEYNTIDEMSVL